MKLLAAAIALSALAFAPPVLATGIDGKWDCRYAASTIAYVTIEGTSYTLDTTTGEHGAGSFAFVPDGTAWTLDGYLADKLHVVGGQMLLTFGQSLDQLRLGH